MRRLIISDAARDDMDAVTAYLDEESGNYDVADALIAKFNARFERLAGLPGTLGTPRSELKTDLRSVPESGYVIFFRYLGDVLEIVNVLHGSRDIVSFYDTGDDR